MAGKTLAEQGITEERTPKFVSVKESVFPFAKFPGVDIVLGPEMRSTGEVMGIAPDFAAAFAKSQLGASSKLPMTGTVFVSVAARDRKAIVPIAAKLQAMGYDLMCTGGTAAALTESGINGGDRPQGPRRPPEPARPPGQRRDRPDREHALAEREPGPTRGGFAPRPSRTGCPASRRSTRPRRRWRRWSGCAKGRSRFTRCRICCPEPPRFQGTPKRNGPGDTISRLPITWARGPGSS